MVRLVFQIKFISITKLSYCLKTPALANKTDGVEMKQCTEGWECNLGFGRLESFFANNGLGGFLGPKWKVFHHGTPRKHFQGVGIACGSRPSSEKGQKMGKKSIKLFCLKKMQFILKVGGKLKSMQNPVHTCPKTHQK